MKSVYSIIRYVNNPLSNENIAFGLIAIADGKISFKFAEDKIDFILKLNPSIQKIFEFSVNKLKASLEERSVEPNLLFKTDTLFSKEYLNRLSEYNNGIIQFDRPSSIDISLKNECFLSFFNNYIALNVVSEKKAKEASVLKRVVKSELYNPLKDQIDVDYKLKKKQIPSLFFDFHLDGLGVNGAIYSAKAVDINSGKAVHQICKEISEFESVNQRLDEFGKSKGIIEPSKHYLIIDQYNGNKISYLDLYSILSQSNCPFYELISSSEIHKIVSQIKKTKARKFSLEFSEA